LGGRTDGALLAKQRKRCANFEWRQGIEIFRNYELLKSGVIFSAGLRLLYGQSTSTN
jgi:hypothetical protein